MSGTSLPEIQEAIYAKFTSDSTLMGLITGVFDYGAVPENQPFPYITLGDGTEVANDTLDPAGYEATVTEHIWTQADGFDEIYTILAQMNGLLHRKALTLATLHHVGTWYEYAETRNDPGEDNIQHTPVRYRILSQEQ